jgi:hypothetical protein
LVDCQDQVGHGEEIAECESQERRLLATDNMFRHQTEERSLYADDPVSPSEFPLGVSRGQRRTSSRSVLKLRG